MKVEVGLIFSNLITLLHLQVYINISSLLALQPFKTWANYCGAKAARYVNPTVSELGSFNLFLQPFFA
jgi:hypothetical protein